METIFGCREINCNHQRGVERIAEGRRVWDVLDVYVTFSAARFIRRSVDRTGLPSGNQRERESERFYGGHFVISEIRVSEKRLPAGTAPFSWTPSIFLLHVLVTHRVSLWVSSCIENDSSKSMSCMLFVRTTRLG